MPPYWREKETDRGREREVKEIQEGVQECMWDRETEQQFKRGAV